MKNNTNTNTNTTNEQAAAILATLTNEQIAAILATSVTATPAAVPAATPAPAVKAPAPAYTKSSIRNNLADKAYNALIACACAYGKADFTDKLTALDKAIKAYADVLGIATPAPAVNVCIACLTITFKGSAAKNDLRAYAKVKGQGTFKKAVINPDCACDSKAIAVRELAEKAKQEKGGRKSMTIEEQIERAQYHEDRTHAHTLYLQECAKDFTAVHAPFEYKSFKEWKAEKKVA